MGNCIPGELCFVLCLGLGVVCSLHRGVLAGARSQVSSVHCILSQSQGICEESIVTSNDDLLEMREKEH